MKLCIGRWFECLITYGGIEQPCCGAIIRASPTRRNRLPVERENKWTSMGRILLAVKTITYLGICFRNLIACDKLMLRAAFGLGSG